MASLKYGITENGKDMIKEVNTLAECITFLTSYFENDMLWHMTKTTETGTMFYYGNSEYPLSAFINLK